ncbi:MAG: DUF6502 family protein [Sterolibacterium sp.]
MSESRTDLVLAAALRLMLPLVELLLKQGVDYPRFASAIKTTFLQAAENILDTDTARVTDSSISTLSGVHRKDVRAWRAAGEIPSQSRNLSAVMVLFTRWASDPEYCDAQGKPRVLDRVGAAGSFEALALSVSNDVHPRTLLQELMRLGVVRQLESGAEGSGEKLMLCADAFVPKEGIAEMLQLFSDNVGDHMATAAHNIARSGDPMLEQSVYANELRPQSAEALDALSRQIWARAFREVAAEATKLCRRDRGKPDANRRIRFGMYYYQGPTTAQRP